MRTSNIRIYLNDVNEHAVNDFIPLTLRYNSLSDVEINFIEHTIKSQSIQNQMNMKLMGLKHSLNKVLLKA